MVNIETITGPLPISIAGQRSIQAVAELIQKYANVDDVQHHWVLPACRVEHARQEHGHEAEQR